MSDGGSIKSTYILDISQVPQAAQQIRGAFQGVQQAAEANVKTFAQMEAEIKGLGATIQKDTADTKASIESQAKLAAALGDRRRAIELLESGITAENAETEKGIRLAIQITQLENQEAAAARNAADAAQKLAQAQQQAAEKSSLVNQFVGGLKSGLLGIIGPLALAQGAISAVKGTVDSFVEAFKFKATLDQNNASIALSLSGTRDIGKSFEDAAAFANRYKLTQEDTTTAIQASIPILRSSHASLSDVEAVLLRLQAKKPEKSLADAARALDELNAGQINSIVRQFNISRDAANEMKDKINQGGDAVQILSDYLASAGFGMQTLELRAKGTAGALNDAAQAQERLKLAQGKFAEGPGKAIVNTQATGTNLVAGQLAGDTSATAAYTASLFQNYGAISRVLSVLAVMTPRLAGTAQGHQQAAALAGNATTAYNVNAEAVRANAGASGLYASVLSEETQKKLEDQAASAKLTQEQQNLERDSMLAAQGLLGAGDQALLMADKYRIATSDAQTLIDKQQALFNGTALADQRVGERDPGNTLTAAEFRNFDRLADQGAAEAAAEAKRAADKAAADAKAAAAKAAQDAKALRDAQNGLALAKATTKEQKIAVLQRQLGATTDPVERIRLQTQIEQERNSAAKGHTSELNKQLSLNERNYDSINKQRDALLDIRELEITGRQADRKAKDDDRIAQKVIAATAGRTDARALDFRGRAEDVVALDAVQREKREFELEQKRATANATIVNGRVLQSRPGGGIPAPATDVGGGGGTGAPAGAAPASSSSVITLRLVDSGGRVIAETVEPFIMDSLLKGVRAVAIQKGA